MDEFREVGRLNLTVEFISECAGLANTDAVIRIVAERLRWVFDFHTCVLALAEGGTYRWLSIRGREVQFSPLVDGSPGTELARASLASGAPSADGTSLAYPIGSSTPPQGVLCISGSARFVHRDLRFLHHIGSALGAALARIETAKALEQSREVAAERARLDRDEALAATRAKDLFLAMLGHELRNPLAPILSATALLKRTTAGPAQEHVAIVERQVRHLDRLIDDLLDVSRLAGGKLTLKRKVFDLRDAMSKASEMSRPLLASRDQRLQVSVPNEPAWIDGDQTRLLQVVSNLLNNAAIYSPVGSTVGARLEIAAEIVRIEVRDEGIGIAPELQDRMFEPFVQGDRNEGLAPGGLGLGLAVARALVDLHGGVISVASGGKGRGSIFTVTLPRVMHGPAPSVERSSSPTPELSGTPRRILLVDDNVDAADTMALLLQTRGHEVRTASSPHDALDQAAAYRPDIAILDIGLPGMNGYQLAGALRTQLRADTPKLIALSGYGQRADLERSQQSGFLAHLVKPIDLDDLLSVVEAAGG